MTTEHDRQAAAQRSRSRALRRVTGATALLGVAGFAGAGAIGLAANAATVRHTAAAAATTTQQAATGKAASTPTTAARAAATSAASSTPGTTVTSSTPQSVTVSSGS